MKKLFLLFVVSLFLLAGCEKNDEVKVNAIEFSQNEMVVLVGQVIDVPVFHQPEHLNAPEYDWESSDPSVLKVDANGKITALKVGSAVLSVNGGIDLFASCTVTVNPVNLEGIVPETSEIKLLLGESATIAYTLEPDTATWNEVQWSVTHSDVAQVVDGVVTGVGLGTTSVRISEPESGLEAFVSIEVLPVPVESILLEEEYTLFDGETLDIDFSFLPENATDPVFAWSSSNEDVVSVNDGVLSAHSPGTAMIKVEAEPGEASAVFTVTVQAVSVSDVELNTIAAELEMNRTMQLQATVSPVNATNKEVRWSSSDPSIATVDSDGLVRGLVEGVAEITVTTVDGSFASVCSVEVILVKATGVRLDVTELKLLEAEQYQLLATIKPADAYNRDLIWTSSDASVVSVSEDGLLTTHALGSAYIEATTKDGGYTARCTVSVVDITGFVSTMFVPLSISSFNGYLFGQMGFAVFNRSSQDILLTKLEVFDGAGGNLVGRTTRVDLLGILEGSQSVGTTLTMSLDGVYKPRVVWTYEFNGNTYTVEEQYQ